MSFMLDDDILTEVDKLSYQLHLQDVDEDPAVDVQSIHSHQERCSVLHYCLSVRLRICLLLCGAMFAMQYMNISMSMAIISMTVPQPVGHDPNNHTWDNSTFFHAVDWSPSVQGLILSSLSWGRMFTPFSGILCDKLNSKLLIGIGVSVAGVATVMIPTGSQISAVAVMICRVVIGFGDAVVMPTVNRYIALWFPRNERNLAVSLSTGGRQLAIIVVFPLAGIMASHHELLGGWPVVFYSAGIFSCLWLPFWLSWANQTPGKHKCITEKEKLKIAHGTDIVKLGKGQKVPWKQMLTSAPLLANILAIVCHEIPVNVIFTFLPTYVRDILHIDVERNGLLSGIPAAAFLAAKLSSSHTVDVWLRKHKRASKNRVMKIMNAVASIGLAAFLIAASFFNCSHQVEAITLLACAIAFSGLHSPGCISNLVNIAPAFVGTISGMTFFVVGITSILNPIIVKTVVQNGRHEEWKLIFYGLAVIAALPVFFFTIWGSSDVQEWGFAYVSPPKNVEERLVKTMPVIAECAAGLEGHECVNRSASEQCLGPHSEKKAGKDKQIWFQTSEDSIDSIGKASGITVASEAKVRKE